MTVVDASSILDAYYDFEVDYVCRRLRSTSTQALNVGRSCPDTMSDEELTPREALEKRQRKEKKELQVNQMWNVNLLRMH